MAEFQTVINPTGIDWVELYAFVRREYAYMNALIDPPSSLHRMTADQFEQKANNETLIVANASSGLIGCVFCREEVEWIYAGKVAVDSKHRGKGVARAMFVQAFNRARQAGKNGVELEVRIELTHNHRAFQKLGFVKVGESAHAGYDRPTTIRMQAGL